MRNVNKLILAATVALTIAAPAYAELSDETAIEQATALAQQNYPLSVLDDVAVSTVSNLDKIVCIKLHQTPRWGQGVGQPLNYPPGAYPFRVIERDVSVYGGKYVQSTVQAYFAGSPATAQLCKKLLP